MEEFEELTFEERSHTYHLEGVQIPSVTTIMKPLSQEYYRGINQEVLEKAAQKGTAVHNAIENFLNYGIEDIDEAHAGYFEAFKKWKAEWDVKLIKTERKVYHKTFRYAGTVDLICEEKGVITMVDFKTTVNLSPMLLGVQLEAYRRALESHGEKISNVVGLQLKKDGSYVRATTGILPPEIESYQTFCALLTVSGFMNKYKK